MNRIDCKKQAENQSVCFCVLFLLLFLFVCEKSRGVEELPPAKPMGELIQVALEQNPEIQAAKAAWLKTIERYPQETALDDPLLSFSYYAENVETRVGPQNYAVGISQKIPFPGTLRQKGRVVEKEIEIASLQYQKAIRDVIAELKIAVYELTYLDGAIQITKENQSILKDILSLTQAKYIGETATLNEVFLAETQLAQLDYDLITLNELRVVQISVLNALLNQAPDTVMAYQAAPIPQDATITIEDAEALLAEYNQEIRLSALGVEKADATVQLAQKQNLPMFSIGANYIDTGESLNPALADSGKDPVIIGGSMTIPLWMGKNKARIRIAEEDKNTAAHRKQTVLNQHRVLLRKIFFSMQNASRLVTLYRDHLLPQASHAFDVGKEQERIQQGHAADVLESQTVWMNFNLAWLRAQVDYSQAWVQLEKLLGGSVHPGKGTE
jgi:outer membrane protein, heavy metal efflux system